MNNNIYKELLRVLDFNEDNNVFTKYDIIVTFDNDEFYSINGAKKMPCDCVDYNCCSGAYGMVRSPFELYTYNIIEELINAKGLSKAFANAIMTYDYFDSLIAFVLYEKGHYDKFAIEMYGKEAIFDIDLYDEYISDREVDAEVFDWCIKLLSDLI